MIAAENAWLSPLPPEGASVIVHGDTSHAPEMATRQRVRAADLLADGIVQHVVPEVDGGVGRRTWPWPSRPSAARSCAGSPPPTSEDGVAAVGRERGPGGVGAGAPCTPPPGWAEAPAR